MKQFLKNKTLTILLFIASALAMEAFLFIYLGFGFLPRYVFLDLALILFVSFIILFMPCGKGANVLAGVFLFLQLVLSYMNICIYESLGDVFTFDMLSLVDETARVVTLNMLPIWPLVFYISLFAMDIVFLVLIRTKIHNAKMSYRSVTKFLAKNIAILGLSLSFCLYTVAGVKILGSKDGDLYLFSDKVLYSSFSSGKQSLIKFGTWGYYVEEFFRRFYQIDNVVSYTKKELLAYSNSKEYEPSSQKLYGVAEGDNVLVIMLESFEWYAITPELTPTLYALANGYNFGTRVAESGLYSNFDYYDFMTGEDGKTLLERTDYTYNDGVYEKIEEKEALNPDYFGDYGITLTNYYSKSKTDYSEASVILGNYPYNKSFTTHGGILGYSSKNLYSNVDYSFSLPGLLKKLGAVETTNYMHSYMSTFYGRDTLIPQFGFDNLMFLDQMSKDINRGDSLAHIAKDSEIIDYYLNNPNEYDFLPKDKSFLSFYTTVTTHGQYDENPLLTKNYEFVDSLDYLGKDIGGLSDIGLDEYTSGMVRTYLASCLDTEHMVTLIIKYLMENDMFENTSIVLFSDHQCYYDGMDKNYKKFYFTDDDNGFTSPKVWERSNEYAEEYGVNSQDRYLVPAIIYSTKITDSVVGNETGAHFIDKFTCAFDLTVTLFNMLGVDYNPSFYLGYPVLCKTYNKEKDGFVELGVPAYVSCTGGIFNEYINTEDGKNVTYFKTNVTPKDLNRFTYDVSTYIERWYKITALYDYDMFYMKKPSE